MRKGHHIALFGENVSAMVNHFKNNRCFHSFELDTIFSPPSHFCYLLLLVTTLQYVALVENFELFCCRCPMHFNGFFFNCYLAVSRINKYPLFSVHQSA